MAYRYRGTGMASTANSQRKTSERTDRLHGRENEQSSRSHTGLGVAGRLTLTSESPAIERIRDAAVELFGERGFSGVSLKTIARKAGVSAPLVVHYYGSKAELRRACDRYAAAMVYRLNTESVQRGENLSLPYVLAITEETKPFLKYLFQAFAAGGPEMDMLLDRLIDDSLSYMEQAEAQGLVKPSCNPRHRAGMMFLQMFGSMMLHVQMKRLIGTSPVDDPPDQWGPYFETVMEIYHGVFEPGAYEQLGSAFNVPWANSPPSTGDTVPERTCEDPHQKEQTDE